MSDSKVLPNGGIMTVDEKPTPLGNLEKPMDRRLAAILAADMAGYSRLMELNEDDVLVRQKAHRRELIEPEIRNRGGRIVKTTGDGMLVEFASAQDAVRCAIGIQTAMVGREAHTALDNRIVYRVGVNLGDVIFDEGDVFGDGVNVAARLQALSKPGGVCVSDIVHQTIGGRIGETFRDMGSQRVKNISRPIRVWQWAPDMPHHEPELDELALHQRVQFVTTPDEVRLAWAAIGEGQPVMKAPNWLNHLEYEWQSPVWGPVFGALARRCRLIRFDQRGNGLSDWDVKEISADTMIADIGSVASAAGLDRFALLGISQGCAFSIRYAVENPGRVTCLILLGGYLRGRLKRPDPDQKKLYEVLGSMIRDGWGSSNPVFRHFFTSNFIPDASPEVGASFDELQRIATSPDNALRIWRMNAEIDATDLARRVTVPTLVLHCRGDRVAPLEEGRLMARLVPGAHFVELSGNNHAIIEGTPAFDQFFEEATAFLSQHRPESGN
jgi:class 3 adenylate cyclase/pimeloyl-ACP methyl ester carboxylesterase